MWPLFGVGVTRFFEEKGDASGNGSKGFVPNMSEEDLQRRVSSMIRKQGGSDQAIALLLKDNAEIREKNRLAREAIDVAGKNVVKPEDVTELAEYRKLKLKPEEVVTLQRENKDLKGANEKAGHKTTVRLAAKALGVNEEVLEDQLELKGQHLEMRDVHVAEGDKTVVKKMPYVRNRAEANAPLVAATEWISTLQKPYQDALKSGVSSEGDKDENLSITPFVSQGSADKAPPSGKVKAVESHIKATYGGPLPFETPTGEPAKQGA